MGKQSAHAGRPLIKQVGMRGDIIASISPLSIMAF